jgi:hypothetical protein
VTDSDTLVIFRDGFNVSNGDGTQTVHQPLDASTNLVLTVPSARATSPVDALLIAIANDGSGFRIERCNLGSAPAVRFVVIAADAAEKAGGWIQVVAGERLAIGVFDTSPHPTVVLESANAEHLLTLSSNAPARFDVRISTTK